MGSSSTYGIEQEDGSVIYNTFGSSVFHDFILNEFRKGIFVEIVEEISYHSTSIQDYYSYARFTEDNSVVSGLLRLDGTLEYKFWDDKGIYGYTRKH